MRENAGMSQEQLMAQLQLMGMDAERGVIKRIENGDRAVSDLELQLLSKLFHVSYQYLIDGTGSCPDLKDQNNTEGHS